MMRYHFIAKEVEPKINSLLEAQKKQRAIEALVREMDEKEEPEIEREVPVT